MAGTPRFANTCDDAVLILSTVEYDTADESFADPRLQLWHITAGRIRISSRRCSNASSEHARTAAAPKAIPSIVMSEAYHDTSTACSGCLLWVEAEGRHRCHEISSVWS